MKIEKVEITNFRQFKGKNTVEFDTDGKITVILGDNGTGKTTLMQFFNWVFYGNYFFDNDQNGKLYNIECDDMYSFGTTFSVEGTIYFTHESIQYRLTRSKQFKKGYNSSQEEGGHSSLIFRDDLFNWTPIADVESKVNEILPRALSKYFLFDGERKITDFNLKTGDTLEKAIFSMFDIDIIKNACDHIGEISSSNSLLGRIAKLKSSSKSGLNQKASDYLIIAQEHNDRAVSYQKKVEKDQFEAKKTQELIDSFSQRIGKAQGTKDLEQDYKFNTQQIGEKYKVINQAKVNYGKTTYKNAPYLLLSEKAYLAAMKIQENEPEKKIVFFEGVRKDLLKDVLLKKVCICGNPIHNEEEKHLQHIIDTMPPNSYKSIFFEFKSKAHRYISSADNEYKGIVNHMSTIATSYQHITTLELRNKELIERMREAKDVQDLIDSREQLKQKLMEINSRINYNYGLQVQNEKQRDTAKKLYEKAISSEVEVGKYERHIEIARIAKEFFEKKLKSQIVKSKNSLEENIRDVYNKISTTERKHIYLNSDYTLVVKNDDNSTYKSGGQDIIIMYSYIGGIMTTLQKMGLEKEGKEYPLIIDAPFSKVDGSQLGSVTEALSKVAPQVIIMTFDSDRLDTRADRSLFGKIWRIDSNPTKTVSEIKETAL